MKTDKYTPVYICLFVTDPYMGRVGNTPRILTPLHYREVRD
jgi:hypothetical protein